jgi:hypothetical protein
MKQDPIIQLFLSDPRCAVYADGSIRNIYGKHYFGTLTNSGYRAVKYKNYPLSVARIVCSYFHGICPEKEVNHKDGNPDNNAPSNLEWVTHSENQIHRYRVLNSPSVRGHTKINPQIAQDIRLHKKAGLSVSILAKKYNLAKSTISYIINNKTWKN